MAYKMVFIYLVWNIATTSQKMYIVKSPTRGSKIPIHKGPFQVWDGKRGGVSVKEAETQTYSITKKQI